MEKKVIKLDTKSAMLSFHLADGRLSLAMSESDLVDLLKEVGNLPEKGSTVVMQTTAARDMGLVRAGEVLETDTYGGVRQIARAGQNLPEPYYKFVCVVPAYLLVVQRLEQNATA